MAFISKGKSIAVAKEVSYAAPAPTFLTSDFIDYNTAEISTDIAKIERKVVRNSMLKLESLLGEETSSGTINVEVSGVDTGVLNADVLYENGIGKKLVSNTATTVTTGTVSSVTVTSVSGFLVGQVIRINLATGNEFAQISDIVGDVLSITPNLSSAPLAGDAIQGLMTYVLPKPNEAVASLAIRENLQPTTGNTISYTYLGSMVTDTTLTYPMANIATAAFSVGGAGFTVNGNGSVPTLPCTLATPIIGKNATVVIGGVDYVAQDVTIKVGTTITDVKSITSEGISNKIAVEKIVTGSFKVEYTGIDNFTAYQEGTKAALTLLLKDGGKTSPVIHGVVAPQIKFTKVTKSEDGQIFYDNIEFEVLAPDCGTTERGLSVFFA